MTFQKKKKEAIMEQHDFKTGVRHGNQSSGLPSQRAPLHLAQHGITAFHRLLKGVSAESKGGGLGVAVRQRL